MIKAAIKEPKLSKTERKITSIIDFFNLLAVPIS